MRGRLLMSFTADSVSPQKGKMRQTSCVSASLWQSWGRSLLLTSTSADQNDLQAADIPRTSCCGGRKREQKRTLDFWWRWLAELGPPQAPPPRGPSLLLAAARGLKRRRSGIHR